MPYDGCKTSSDVWCRDVASEESTREDVGCGGNEWTELGMKELEVISCPTFSNADHGYT